MLSVLLTVLAGILGTAGMSIVMWLITRSGIANANMIRAIGSLFTRSYENSLTPGVIMHFAAGAIIAFFYVALISLLAPDSVGATIGAGALIGVFHGVAFSFVLVVAVAEHHTLERFRNAGPEVAVAHFAGHVIYGLIVGLIVGIFTIRFF